MVVKMMKWRPWPPNVSRKFDVKLTVDRIQGNYFPVEKGAGLSVEIRWKGHKNSLRSFRKSVKRNCTKKENLKDDDDNGQNGDVLVEWNEEFQNVCSFSSPQKDSVSFQPWEINFTVLHVLNQGLKNKINIVGLATLNLAEYASKTDGQVIEVKIPLSIPGIATDRCPFLCISLSLFELRAAQESSDMVQNPIVPSPSSTSSTEKYEVSAIKAGLKKVSIFTEFVSARKSKKTRLQEGSSEGKSSVKSEGEYAYPFDTDSADGSEEVESDDGRESSVRKSFSYGTLAYANYVGVSGYSVARINNGDENWVYYSNRPKSDVDSSRIEDMDSAVSEQAPIQISKRSILPWRKRKHRIRSPKGEPLLKKAYAEEGGDDIDFDRRQLSSDGTLSFGWHKTDEDSSAKGSSVSEFGDDNFAVGTWEQKEITSRDGQMKIQTSVFFASIDQRSERAAGESACTALVAVIAHWLQNNHNLMPIKSQFDTLIRDGSLEWRNLCENETYKERFPDKHFDLETVVQAKVRDLTVMAQKSFIGFFHPDTMEEGKFDFLHGAMSFDNIWDEINSSECDTESPIFIVSWNDHFFVLKVEKEAYYIIDTLGERLHEGCNQAYILKFDRNSKIYILPSHDNQSSDKKLVESSAGSKEGTSVTESEEAMKIEEEEERVVCEGTWTCKEYIKNFLAAIPIRELEADMKKGLLNSTPLHHRLQIEFHYTQLQEPTVLSSASTAIEVQLQEPAVLSSASTAIEVQLQEPAVLSSASSGIEVQLQEPAVLSSASTGIEVHLQEPAVLSSASTAIEVQLQEPAVLSSASSAIEVPEVAVQ